jgi:cell division septal protein FtsQ
MPLKKNKKILLYFFLFLFIGTLNNRNISNFEFPKINQISVSGLSELENLEISKSLEVYKIHNLFFLNKNKIKELIDQNNYVEEFFIYKKYPSSLIVKLRKTKFLAYISKSDKIYYVGSNGKLIRAKDKSKELPYIYGDLDINEFFKLRKIINMTNFKFEEIKNLIFFTSGRWDIETHSGVLIKLPKLKIKKSLNLYVEISKKGGVGNYKIIDFRQNNQVIING